MLLLVHIDSNPTLSDWLHVDKDKVPESNTIKMLGEVSDQVKTKIKEQTLRQQGE